MAILKCGQVNDLDFDLGIGSRHLNASVSVLRKIAWLSSFLKMGQSQCTAPGKNSTDFSVGNFGAMHYCGVTKPKSRIKINTKSALLPRNDHRWQRGERVKGRKVIPFPKEKKKTPKEQEFGSLKGSPLTPMAPLLREAAKKIFADSDDRKEEERSEEDGR